MTNLPRPDMCRRCQVRSAVIASRSHAGYRVRRHRCPACGARWNTYESIIDPRRISVRRPETPTSGDRPLDVGAAVLSSARAT